MFIVKNIFDDNYHLKHTDKILDYCKQAFNEKDQPGHANMWHEDWENQSSTLPYLLYCSERFTNGNGMMLLLLDEDDNILGTSGANVSEFDRNVVLGGVRTWLNKDLRGQFMMGRHVLPHQLKWATESGFKTLALTFNDYNKRLLPYFARSGLGIKKKRMPGSLFYNGQYILDFPVIINYTKQWVVYHKIDELYQPDWESIRFTEDK
jgi:hypothetical protein